MVEIVIGTEIECCLNNTMGLHIGEYHNGHPIPGLDGWKVEEDGSIEVPDDLQEWSDEEDDDECPCDPDRIDDWTPAEFITKKCNGYDEFVEHIAAFRKYFSKNGRRHLSAVLDFNRSCGCHVHFSIPGKKAYKVLPTKAFVTAREFFLKEIDESKVLSKQNRQIIRERYFRSYSKKTDDMTRFRYDDKYLEWNLGSEVHGQGMEWRSLNMGEISTWEEFDEYWHIVLRSIKRFMRAIRDISEEEVFSFRREMVFADKILSDSFELERQKKQRTRTAQFVLTAHEQIDETHELIIEENRREEIECVTSTF